MVDLARSCIDELRPTGTTNPAIYGTFRGAERREVSVGPVPQRDSHSHLQNCERRDTEVLDAKDTLAGSGLEQLAQAMSA